MVSVCPTGTVRLAVAIYGLQALLHVPETLPETKQAPSVKQREAAKIRQSADRKMEERSAVSCSLPPGDLFICIVDPVVSFSATLVHLSEQSRIVKNELTWK